MRTRTGTTISDILERGLAASGRCYHWRQVANVYPISPEVPGMYVLMALGGCGHRTPLQDERAPYMWADHLEASYCGKAHAGMTADDGHISMRLGDTNSRCQLTDWFTRVHIGTAVPPSFRPSSQRLQWNNSNGMTFHHCLVHQMNQFIR